MKRKISLLLVVAMMICFFSGCVDKKKNASPDLSQIRNICNLATLKCYYHNVAKSRKKAESGITHIGEKDRIFWIEYNGVAKLGIDMSQVEMKVKKNDVKLTIPPAKVLEISIDKETLNEDSYIYSDDGINKNKISADEQSKAIEEAQLEMKKTVEENTSLLISAQNRAKTLIENYIIQLGKATGVDYNIKWSLEKAE